VKHVGVDLGSSQSAICIVNASGEIESEETRSTAELDTFFEKLEPCTIVMESCAESRMVALIAQGHQHDVRVVPTSFVRALGVGARRIKTDKRDARSLAEASFRMREKLPTVHVRGDEAAAIQDLLRAREQLIHCRTAAINFVRSWLRKQLLGRPRSTPETFCDRVRERLAEREVEMDLAVSAHLAVIDTLNTQLDALDKRLRKEAQARDETKRLMAISGVGPIVALAFLVAVDDPKRFASSSQIASYVGLSPGENTTGGNVRRTGVVAAGQKQLRALLVQAAHSKMNARLFDPMAQWARALESNGKKRKVVVCALARRLTVVMWAMLRDGSSYDPRKTMARQPTVAANAANLFAPDVSEISVTT
jgi:transposase